MFAASHGFANGLRAIRLDNRGSAVVHADHHGGRRACRSDSFYDDGCGAVALTQSADFICADQSKEAGPTECFNRCSREGSLLVYVRGGWGNDLLDNLVNGFQVRLRCWRLSGSHFSLLSMCILSLAEARRDFVRCTRRSGLKLATDSEHHYDRRGEQARLRVLD